MLKIVGNRGKILYNPKNKNRINTMNKIHTNGFNSLYFPLATDAIVYVMKPNAIPNDIEYDRIIMMMVMNTEATIARLSHSMSLIWVNIKIPTITNAAAVTDEVNNDKTVGAKNTERLNHPTLKEGGDSWIFFTQ